MDDSFRDKVDNFNYAAYCDKCLDDHEERIRIIEKNNKFDTKLDALETKVWAKFDANEKVYTARLTLLEKFVSDNVAVVAIKKEGKHDTLTVISLVIACISLVLVGLKLIL
jgi:hypothetical protein